MIEHPAVLQGRWNRLRTGRRAIPAALAALRWSDGSREELACSLPIAARTEIAGVVILDRETSRSTATLQDIDPQLILGRADMLERSELSKNQRRHRQVMNFSRMAMAHEYAYPGSGLFGPLLKGNMPAVASALKSVSIGFQLSVGDAWSPEIAEQLTAAWEGALGIHPQVTAGVIPHARLHSLRANKHAASWAARRSETA
jgi:hypothetical protein